MTRQRVETRFRPVIRVFVSSTFSDMKPERNALHADVFPKLEQLCQRHGFQFQAIDLRWGVSTEAGLDHRTMRICFDELWRAQEISPRPNFLILLGNRFGWRPLPEEISVEEFHTLEHAAAQIPGSADKSAATVLREWYREDTNVIPPVYLLQPRRQDLGDNQDYTRGAVWKQVQTVLWIIINRAMPPEQLQRRFDGAAPDGPPPAIVRFQASATEQEIWHGAIRVPDAREHVLAFFRDIENRTAFSDPKQIKDFIDVDPSGSVEVALQTEQDRLKAELRNRLGSANIFRNKAFARLVEVQDNQGDRTVDVTTDHLAQLCADVESRLSEIIQGQIEEYWRNTEQASMDRAARELEIEQLEHDRFARERGDEESFVGRQVELQAILDYVRSDSHWPLVIHGASGCGKTALLARASQEVAKTRKHIERFIGVAPRSSDLRSLLSSLCQELRQQNPRSEALPTEIEELRDEFNQHLQAATPEQPLILFLDALDQLADADNGRLLHWLPPGPLPAHMKLVVSCLSDQAVDDPAGQPYAELKRRQIPSGNFINLDVLSETEARLLLFDRWLLEAGRKVNDDQRARIEQRLASPACRQPIFLKLLFEEVQLWHSYDPTPVPGKSVPALLEQLFDRLSQPTNHGPLLVNRVLGYLSASRHGLAEKEILEILFADPEYRAKLNQATEQTQHELPPNARRIPIALWSRLRFDLAHYLTERAAPGANVLSFYHRQVAEWVREHLSKSSSQSWQPHQRLADHFRNRADPEKNQSWKGFTLRGFDELPYQLVSSPHLHNQLASILGDAAFAAAKASKDAVFDLLNDYDIAIVQADSQVIRCRRVLQLRHIVRLEAKRLNRYPKCSLQQILLDIAALADPDRELYDQAQSLTQAHVGRNNLNVWSLVPEHRAKLDTRLLYGSDMHIENFCATNDGILLRYRGGNWTEYSLAGEKIRSGVTPAAYCKIMVRGEKALVLVSANTAIIWNPWPNSPAQRYIHETAIATVACSADDRFFSLGFVNGSFEIRDLHCADAAPLLRGHIKGPVIATWFSANDSVIWVNANGAIVHATNAVGWTITAQWATDRDIRLACGAGEHGFIIASDEVLLMCLDLKGRLRWEAPLPSMPFAVTSVRENQDRDTIWAGLEDGSLQSIHACDGTFQRAVKVSRTALQSMMWHPNAEAMLCSDSEGKVFVVPTHHPDVVGFRSWPARGRILAARWNESADQLETLSSEGERYAICREETDGAAGWRIKALQAIHDHPFDAWLLSGGRIVTLHREPDESQIWLHHPKGNGRIRSRCFWRGKSFFNATDPPFIHSMAVSRCGRYYAATFGDIRGHYAFFREGRLGWFAHRGRWLSRHGGIDEMVLSDNGIVLVFSGVEGGSGQQLVVPKLTCGQYTYTLLENGGVRGLVQSDWGRMRSLQGITISRDGCTIAVIDSSRQLWMFSFDPNSPNVPPTGHIQGRNIVACALSDSGKLCAALQTDHAIGIHEINDENRLLPLGIVLPATPPLLFHIADEGRCLLFAGEDDICAVSFSAGNTHRTEHEQENTP